MSMIEWAKKEIELAKKQEIENAKKDGHESDAQYGCECYDSVLEAFIPLVEAGHSGASITITKNILNRLIDGKPLTPIEDTEDIWKDVTQVFDPDGDTKVYQCKRMSSLFKYTYADGSVKYKDVNRYFCQDSQDEHNTYTCGLVSRIINEMYPITMPYNPTSKKIKAICSECLTNRDNGDVDTMAIYALYLPDGSKVIVDMYFKEVPHDWVEIQYDEWIHRLAMSHKRIAEEKEQED